MKSIAAIALALAALFSSPACGGGSPRKPAPDAPGRPKIGLLMATLAQERWRRDQELFTARAKELRTDVIVKVANEDAALQARQASELLAEGVKVLVIVPADTEAASAIVETARQKGVPVVTYDRLIRNADVNLYVSFDSIKVGEMQAQYLLNLAPRGNYLLIGGSPSDHNAELVRQGQMKVLKPAIAAGDIRIVGEGWAKDWLASEARSLTEAALKKTRNNIVAVVASNDATAEGAIEALAAHGLAGKVRVSGQDAELDAVRRLVAGTQTMTVYKPLRSLARLAAGAAAALAKGEPAGAGSTINNGKKDVPAMLVEPMSVDKENLDRTVISDGFQKREDVYAAAPPR